MPEKEDLSWGVRQRFEFIEWRAFWVGRVNRSDLEERFSISTPQASVDLRAYQEAAPKNIEYISAEKAYLATKDFQPKFLRLSADRYLLQLDAILNGAVAANVTWFGSPPPAAVMPDIRRDLKPQILRSMLRAIEGRRELDIEYQSLTSSRRRSMSPHSLAFDGYRWHVRAWCCEHRDFRDFVLSRILNVGANRPSDADPTDDIEWNTIVRMQITPHPKLDPAQKVAIEHDYGMDGGEFIIETRAALAFYLERRLNLDLQDDIKPERQQIYCSNLAEIRAARKHAQDQAQSRIASKR